jgi:hypothetical protein
MNLDPSESPIHARRTQPSMAMRHKAVEHTEVIPVFFASFACSNCPLLATGSRSLNLNQVRCF